MFKILEHLPYLDYRLIQNVHILIRLIVVWFDLILNFPVNSYGHVGTVSSPNHTFSWASLTKQLTSTSCTYFCL